jgi:hypothetical protein
MNMFGVPKYTVNTGVCCEDAMEAELEDDAGWRRRRVISTAPA